MCYSLGRTKLVASSPWPNLDPPSSGLSAKLVSFHDRAWKVHSASCGLGHQRRVAMVAFPLVWKLLGRIPFLGTRPYLVDHFHEQRTQ